MPARKTFPTAAVRAGFSLTELLVASAVALLVMAGVATMIGTFGRAASQSQALVALAGRMRGTAWQLRQDLSGVTAELVPWARPESNSGYFELLEGPQADTGTTPTGLLGDTDDILLFTTRAVAGPFVGRYGSNSIESDCAELAWFCRQAADQPLPGTTLFNLYRRQLLVAGYVGQPPFFAGGVATPVPAANLVVGSTPLYDLSLRREGASAVPNTLADLTKRENRLFLSSGTGQLRSGTFPYAVVTDGTARLPSAATFDNTDRVWEDVLLTNVISFDVRVFDPQSPADSAYVQLSGSPSATSTLLRAADTRSRLSATYDTWSLHYEFNGLDDDNDSVIDDGTDGLDNNNNGVPDDPAEYETSPPYPVPLRGIEVRIRCYEPSSREVRQMTVRHSFITK